MTRCPRCFRGTEERPFCRYCGTNIISPLDAWIPLSEPTAKLEGKGLRGPSDPRLCDFLANMKAEVDGVYSAFYSRMGESYSMYLGPPSPPPTRWSRDWWRSKWRAVRSTIVKARRRFGLWVGGIDPSELDCGC